MVAATVIQASALGSPAFSGEYRLNTYGDSYSDIGAGFGWIGESLARTTTQGFVLREMANGGDTVAQIRAAFDADWPPPGNAINLQGAINSIRTDVSLASIQADWTAMVETVLVHGGYTLTIVNQSPWMGSVNWTEARQLVTEQFNAWLLVTWPEYVKDVYAALGDPAESRQLADEFYKADRTDTHPSHNGDIVIDDNIGDSYFFANGLITREAEAGNSHPNPNTPSAWSNNLRATVGGNSIRMCDGTYSSVNGIIPSVDSISHIARENLGIPPDNSDIVVKLLVKAGNHRWVKIEYKSTDGGLHVVYVDLYTSAKGTETGVATWSTSKAAKGWVEIVGVGNSGVGSLNNLLTVFPAEADADINFTGDARTPSCYVDRVQFIVT